MARTSCAVARRAKHHTPLRRARVPCTLAAGKGLTHARIVRGSSMGHSLLLSGRRITSARLIAAAVASVLALGAVLVATGRGPHVALPPAKTAPGSAPLPLSAQGAISDALGRNRSEFHVVAGPGGLTAGNSAMGMSASFGARGTLVRAGGATFGLHLLGYGPVDPRAHANRVAYEHGAITEWYSNGPLGLEQGFDVKRAPAGAAGDLALRLGLSGNVRARAAGSNALTLTGPRRPEPELHRAERHRCARPDAEQLADPRRPPGRDPRPDRRGGVPGAGRPVHPGLRSPTAR